MRKAVLVAIAVMVLSLQFGVADVHAQTTNVSFTNGYDVSRLTVPKGALIGVPFMVVYSGGHNLVVSLLDVTTGDHASFHISWSTSFTYYSPRGCRNPMVMKNNMVIQEVCDIRTTADSGTIYVTSNVIAPLIAGDWKLKAIASLADDDFNPIPSSASEFPFTVNVYDKAILIVRLPASVHATVDGVDNGPGSFAANVSIGTHSISVPQIVPINDTSRLMFDGWSELIDLLDYKSSNLTIDVSTNWPGYLSASYLPQYKVTLTSPLSLVPREEWYDLYSSANFSMPTSPQPMRGTLGFLGAKWVFDGWYANGRYLSNSSTVWIPVEAPLSLEARWHPDYTIPIIITGAIAIVAGASALLVLRRRNMHVRRSG